MSQFSSSWLANYEARQQPVIRNGPAEPEQLESTLHDKIMAYCDARWPRWKYIRCRMDRRSTIAVGAQDFTIFGQIETQWADGPVRVKESKVWCVECKARNEKPDPEQLAWHKEMEMLGHKVHVVRSMEEFLEVIKQ